VLQSYLPVLVFAGLGIIVGGTFALLNGVIGTRRPNPIKTQSYECGLPSHITRTFRFGVSFYMIAKSVFVLVEILVFVALLLVALVFVWRRGALDWK
jgi:NADH-quinone oxidoreductase subunit A